MPTVDNIPREHHILVIFLFLETTAADDAMGLQRRAGAIEGKRRGIVYLGQVSCVRFPGLFVFLGENDKAVQTADSLFQSVEFTCLPFDEISVV